MALFATKKENPIIKEKPVSKNIPIIDYIDSLNLSTSSYIALCLNTNKLKNQNEASLQRQALSETLANICKKINSKNFSLPNKTSIIIFEKQHLDEVISTLLKMSFVFSDEPIMQNIADINNSEFINPFKLPEKIDDLKELISVSMSTTINKSKDFVNPALLNTGLTNTQTAPKKFKKSLSPSILTKLQSILNSTDFASLIRRQSICAIIGKSTPQVLFDEVFVSIPDMRDTFLPDVDLITNPWLFQALTETLDKGVLNNISRREDSFLTSNFSLNLNIETILSDTFLEFDNNINPQVRSTIVLEVQLVDIFSDMRAYNLAKTLAHSRGYKICIDGITVDKIKYLNQTAFEADFIKVIWAPNLKETLEKEDHFSHYDNKSQRAKFIICRVDDNEAIEVGNDLGINFYQGRYVQKILSQQSKKMYII